MLVETKVTMTPPQPPTCPNCGASMDLIEPDEFFETYAYCCKECGVRTKECDSPDEAYATIRPKTGLISRDALLKDFSERQKLDTSDGGYCDCFLNDAQELSTEWWCVEDAVESAPTIDAVPVVHGRWLTSSDIPDTLICSVCGRRFDMYHFDQMDMPFCLCGAKMDGGV